VRPGPLPIDLFGGGAERFENVLDEGHRDFSFAGVHRVGAGALERVDVTEERRACEDADLRV
jgi:hypothetical protein